MILQQNYIMTADEFIKMLKKAVACKTLYVMGCFGAPMNKKNKERYKKNNAYNRAPARQEMINNATADTFGFDCVCLIKGILWGWTGDKTKTYGGAIYKANGVPDLGANGMFNSHYIKDQSRDFSKIKPGCVVHMDGHVGVYIGNGEVIECTPKWSNDVQVSVLGNLGFKEGHFRIWDNYGYLPCIDYSAYADYKDEINEDYEINLKLTYTVKRGDTLTKIGAQFNRTPEELVELNKKKYPNITRNYIVAGWFLEV